MKPKKRPPGPKPDVLKIDGDWKDAVAKALKTPPPPKTVSKKKPNT